MIAASDFLAACRRRGLTFFTGTPDTYLGPLIDAVAGDAWLTYRVATNEGDAVAMAAGAYVATGRPGVALFQNSGLGNAVNALTSLCHPFRIPMLLVVSHRGRPGGLPDEPQHRLMGEITTRLLDLIRVASEPFPPWTSEIDNALGRALDHIERASLPYAFVLAGDSVAAVAPRARPERAPIGARVLSFAEALERADGERPARAEALAVLRAAASPDDVIVATTGYTGRELYALGDAVNQFYVVGSMGGACPFGLGLAMHRPERRVFVADGDGAVLMRMGNLASVGAFAPGNLLHLVLDNEAHDSTGGQATLSRGVSFGAIARACGYRWAAGTDSVAELRPLLDRHTTTSGPGLVHLRIRTGTLPGLIRPAVTPPDVRRRLMRHLGSG